MAFFDMPLEDLQKYKPTVREPADFDAFWETTLSEARQHDLNPVFELVDYHMALVDTYDVTFSGYGGQPVKGWMIVPKNHNGSLPCVVEFIGYGGGRGFPIDWLTYANAGYAHFIMDTRGQGSAWRQGDTPDIVDGANPSFPGFMTQGILNPESYYYRRVFTDAVRAVETAKHFNVVDSGRIAVTGRSQGGGITIAVSGLLADVQVALPDVPFLCHFERAITQTDRHPYKEISNYLSIHRGKIETILNTLSYFDGVNFAKRSQVPALYSTGLMDMICPPSTVYATYNHLSAQKDIRFYQFNDHEGGQSHQTLEKLKYLADLWV